MKTLGNVLARLVLVGMVCTLSHANPLNSAPLSLVAVNPAPNAVVQSLRQIEVVFSAPVTGVDASDLLINTVPATNVFAAAPGQYVFEFPQPAAGLITVSWADQHGITDLATPPNAFEGGNWTIVLNSDPPQTGVILNEFLASNSTGLRDEDGDTSDWIELWNASNVNVDVTGWFLTDDATRPDKWQFPAVALEPNAYLVVFASGKNRTTNVNRLHTNFQLASSGEYLALLNAFTNVVSSFAPAYPPQQTDYSYGRDRLSPELAGTMVSPTPGAPNSDAGPGFAPEVRFSVSSGPFLQPFELILSTTNAAAEIHYIVLAGGQTALTNLPTLQSPRYDSPIPIDATAQVRARAFKPGYLPGAPRTETFIQLATNAAEFSSDLPIVLIDNLGRGAIPPSGDQPAYMAVFDRDKATGRASMGSRPSVSSRIGLNIRGRGSQGYAKSGFAVEFWDEYGQDKEVEVLGMPAESDWVLYGTLNTDAVLIHNPLAREMSNILGRPASRTRFVEVFLNTAAGPVRYVNPSSGNYNGIYVLMEKIKQGRDRVNVNSLQAEDTGPDVISGGYIFKSDDPPEADEVFFTGAKQQVIMVYPGKRTLAQPQRAAQYDYVRNYFAGFSNALFGVNWTNAISGYAPYVDVDSWIDHAIVCITTFNVDAIRLSGYFYKDRGKPMEMGPVWDYDRSLGSTDGRQINPRFWRGQGGDGGTDYFNPPGPGPAHYWFPQLFRDINFWQRYIDRYQTARRGPYSLTNLYAIIDRMIDEVSEAQPREQAKWGTLAPLRGTNGTGVGTFATEVTWLKTWLANRLEFMDTNFLDLPIIGSRGGLVAPGTQVSIVPAAEAGSSIVYTLDGTDPRMPNGIVSPAAFSNNGPVTITIDGNVRIMARSFNPAHRNLTGANNPPLNSVWSGPQSLTLYMQTPALRITELMYHPAAPPTGDTNDADNFEFIEVRNTGTAPLNLERFRLRGGVDFEFPKATLAAGEYAVVVHDAASFLARYGSGPRILGVYTNDNLANDNDHLILEGPVREPILDFTYQDSWYPATDGAGFSLVIRDDALPNAAWGDAASWRPSGTLRGTPGDADPGEHPISGIVVNELLSHTDPAPGDAVELFNPTAEPVDIGNWYLTDDFGTPKKYRIPAGTFIPADGFLVFYQSNSFGLGANAFALGSKGDAIYLFSGDSDGNLTGYAHGWDFGAQAQGVTFGRHVNSVGSDQFVTQIAPTLGTPNAGPLVGPIVISEIHYHPPDLFFRQRQVDNEVDEFVELHNNSNLPVELFNTTNTWRLRDAINYTFPPSVTIAPGSYLLVVPIDPSDPGQAAGFRSRNNLLPGVPLFGPYRGQLGNSSESLELVRPDVPDTNSVPYILVEKVRYADTEPWPAAADGIGPTLQRRDLGVYANDPGNWVAAAPTPGAAYGGGAAPVISQQPANTTTLGTLTVTFSVVATGPGPLTYQWRFNGSLIPGATSPTLVLPSVKVDQAGLYSCAVLNSSGSVISQDAMLTVIVPANIILHPQDIAAYIKPDSRAANLPNGTNVTFNVGATTFNPPISYQWRFNGRDIPGAIDSSYTVRNVQLEDEGDYSCAVTDGTGTIFSQPGHLAPWLQPVIIIPPVDQTVTAGGSVSLSVGVTGNPLPMGYAWKRNLGALLIATNSGNYRTNFVTLNLDEASLGLVDGMASTNYSMRIIVYNDANNRPGITTTFSITVLADSDHDGIADAEERAIGLNPNDAADAAGDLDNDGMSNRDEAIAGTDPTDPLSYLKLQPGSVPGAAILQFGAVSNHTYTIQYTENLDTRRWSTLADVPALKTNIVHHITDPAWTNGRYYRVATPAGTP